MGSHSNYCAMDLVSTFKLEIMQVINTKTGENVTRDYLALLQGKMTKQEFEKKYNLKKES